MMRWVKRAFSPIGGALRRSRLRYHDLSGEMDIDAAVALQQIKLVTHEAVEEWEGSLDEINVHGRLYTFRLYLIAGRRWITCEIDRSCLAEAQRYLRGKVSVSGAAIYRPYQRFPHRIRVASITLLDGGELEPLDRFTGKLDEQQTEEMWAALADIRNGWTR